LRALKKGEYIGSSTNTIGISLGASWGYGLYYDHGAKVWYVTQQSKVLEIFGDSKEERDKAFKRYYELRSTEKAFKEYYITEAPK